jgi:hypothetical protein
VPKVQGYSTYQYSVAEAPGASEPTRYDVGCAPTSWIPLAKPETATSSGPIAAPEVFVTRKAT